MVGAILGLLAFMLAFTFSLAPSRFDTIATQLTIELAKQILTCWNVGDRVDRRSSVDCRLDVREQAVIDGRALKF
jgi:hypothetical protein